MDEAHMQMAKHLEEYGEEIVSLLEQAEAIAKKGKIDELEERLSEIVYELNEGIVEAKNYLKGGE